MTEQPIPWMQPTFWGNEQTLVAEALGSAWISGGSFVERLERLFSGLCGMPHALAVCNGTAALHVAYLALGIGHGDEIIVPAFCFQAAANMALHVSATPVFADVEKDTWCLDPNDVERRITDRTKAIVAVHSYGNLCDMGALRELAAARRLILIEDTAQSFLSYWNGQPAGSLGDVSMLSLHAAKYITSGEGGMVFTASDDLAARIALHRNHGMERKVYYRHELPGHNFRLSNILAALACAQFEHVDAVRQAKKHIHAKYTERLSGIAGITLQAFRPEVEASLWVMSAKLDPAAFPQGRDAVRDVFSRHGIETRPGYVSASRLPYLSTHKVPVADHLARQVISLPTFVGLTDAQIDWICHVLETCRT